MDTFLNMLRIFADITSFSVEFLFVLIAKADCEILPFLTDIHDIYIALQVDGELPNNTMTFLSTVINGIFSFVVIAVAAPIAILAVVPSLIFYWCLQRQYRASARELQVCLCAGGLNDCSSDLQHTLAYTCTASGICVSLSRLCNLYRSAERCPDRFMRRQISFTRSLICPTCFASQFTMRQIISQRAMFSCYFCCWHAFPHGITIQSVLRHLLR